MTPSSDAGAGARMDEGAQKQGGAEDHECQIEHGDIPLHAVTTIRWDRRP